MFSLHRVALASPSNVLCHHRLQVAAILAYTSLCSTFTSSIFSASTIVLSKYFNISIEVMTLTTSLFVLGYAFGPLIWGPLSELEGRRLPILISMFGFTIFQFATATAKDVQTVMICRFWGGFFGSCPLSVVAAVFADMFDNKMRGPAVVVFASTVSMS